MKFISDVKQAINFGIVAVAHQYRAFLRFVFGWALLAISLITIFLLFGLLFGPKVEISELVSSRSIAYPPSGFKAMQLVQSNITTVSLLKMVSFMFFLLTALMVLLLLFYLFAFGLIRMGLDVYDTNSTTSCRGRLPFRVMLRAALGQAAVLAVSSAGLLLLVIPGLYARLVLVFVPFLLIDQRTGSIGKSMRLSFDAAHKQVLALLMLAVLLSSINILFLKIIFSPLPLIFRLVVFIAWCFAALVIILSYVFLYRQVIPAESLQDAVPDYLIAPYL